MASGKIVLMTRNEKVTGIGKGLRTKVNVNIGTSGNLINISDEIEKAKIAEEFGADTLSELSMGGDITAIRRTISDNTTLPLTTVPIYQTVSEKGIPSMDDDDIIRDIESQIKEGISSIVLHTINQSQIQKIRRDKRIMGVVSKGGSILASYMTHHERKNPHLVYFDQILDLMIENDLVLSLGNAVRSGCIHDHRDRSQEKELYQNIRL